MPKQYWILKTEPGTYSFEDLVKEKKTPWDGVRNYQARNNLQAMKKGDLCYIYHSVGPKEIVGTVSVIKEAHQDATTDDPRWVAIDIKPENKLKNAVTLPQMKEASDLQQMSLLKQSRLSVCPITKSEWDTILKLSL